MKTITIWEVERPEPISNPDITDLKAICHKYMDMVEKGDGAYTDDEQHFIFENALKAIYGENVFEFINERSE